MRLVFELAVSPSGQEIERHQIMGSLLSRNLELVIGTKNRITNEPRIQEPETVEPRTVELITIKPTTVELRTRELTQEPSNLEPQNQRTNQRTQEPEIDCFKISPKALGA